MPRYILNLLVAASNGNGNAHDWPNITRGTLTVSGTWDGATATLEASSDDGVTWIALASGAYTADAVNTVELDEGLKVRMVVSGGGGSEEITATLSLT